MFKARIGRLPPSSLPEPREGEGNWGKPCRLLTNCFRMMMDPAGSIYHYHYTLQPAAKTPAEEKWALEQIWTQLKEHLGNFVIFCPRHIFSHLCLEHELTLAVNAALEKNFSKREVSISMFQTLSAEQVNSGIVGEAEVVMRHAVKMLVEPLKYQRVGRRYFNDYDSQGGKASLAVLGGFTAVLCEMSMRRDCNPQLQLDTIFRTLHKKDIIESIRASLDGCDPIALDLAEVQNEWRRRCIGATVVTTYNTRVYQVKAVHFNKTPQEEFLMYNREIKATESVTFLEFYNGYYQREIMEKKQPLLEAYPEKETEEVFLVPELCAFTGFSEELRKDKAIVTEALKLTKVSPGERFNATTCLTNDISSRVSSPVPNDTGSAKFFKDWKLSMDPQPVEIEGRIFSNLEVSFGNKQYKIEEGNFQRWMRNGLQCPTSLEDWLFIYPETDEPVLDIWLRSLRDIATVAFGMKMADPQKIVCTNQRDELVQLLEEKVTPKTQMVLLLTPQKNSKWVYNLLKETTCTKLPCSTQVVKSETVRKRQSIAAVLSRIVLQINAKFCGPLWNVNLELCAPVFVRPTMVIGIDVYRSFEQGQQEQWIGFAASLDTACTEYYSNASQLDPAATRQSMSIKLQEYTRNALLEFTQRNEGLLPQHIIVYRASMSRQDWAPVYATEIEAIKLLLGSIDRSSSHCEPYNASARYEPELTFIAIARNTGMRFFAPCPNQQATKNPEPGTVIDSPLIGGLEPGSFYLINQAVGKGAASPTHYTVLYDSANLGPNILQNLSYSLSFLYFNYTGSVRMPAPAQYAKKIAHFVGTAVRESPHKRLVRTFFYL